MKTGTIKNIDPNGLWNGLTKYKVTFADGKHYTFFAKGNFKFDVGETITYEVTNEEYKNAKIPQDQYKKEAAQTETITVPNTKYVSKDHLIIRQTCIKAAAEFNAQRTAVDVSNIINDAEIMFNWVTK
jgi:hypothetical protein